MILSWNVILLMIFQYIFRVILYITEHYTLKINDLWNFLKSKKYEHNYKTLIDETVKYSLIYGLKISERVKYIFFSFF